MAHGLVFPSPPVNMRSASNAAYNIHKHAPISPDGTYVAYVANTNDFAVQIVSTNNVNSAAPYNDPTAVLGHPTLKFRNGSATAAIHRSKIIEPPYYKDPNLSNVITKINVGGQITVNMGRTIYHNTNNPYGIDFVVYGNSFYTASGYTGGAVSDATDEGVATIPAAPELMAIPPLFRSARTARTGSPILTLRRLSPSTPIAGTTIIILGRTSR